MLKDPERLRNQMKKISRNSITILFVLCCALPLVASASPETEVRNTVERVFEQLKSGQYGDLYDTLPSSSRARVSRDRFTSALQRTRDMYVLDRIEIGTVRISGSFAVVSTSMYGRVLRPVENEGKIVAQQYLVREDGMWKVATGDRETVRRFLDANPTFARKFPIQRPRVFIKRDGRWVDLGSLMPRKRGSEEVDK
jgi:hypothetical protein